MSNEKRVWKVGDRVRAAEGAACSLIPWSQLGGVDSGVLSNDIVGVIVERERDQYGWTSKVREDGTGFEAWIADEQFDPEVTDE